MAQQVEALVTKPDLSWIPGIHTMDRENQLLRVAAL